MQLTSPLVKGRLRGDVSMYFYSVIVVLAILSPFRSFSFSPLSYLQIVTFLTFENISLFLFSLQIIFLIQRKFFVYLVKNQPSFSKSIGFEMQKHSFHCTKHHLLEAKIYAFAPRKTRF